MPGNNANNVGAETRELCRFASFHEFRATLALNPCAPHRYRSFRARKISVTMVKTDILFRFFRSLAVLLNA
jgi:hypothetical protein